jgi:hypothetical protein
MRLLLLVTLSLPLFLQSTFAQAQAPRTITCNKKITQCLINAPELVFGDHIAIVDERNMWVATGSVDEIERGTKRKVIIIKNYAPVKKNYKFTMISAKEANDPPEVKITRPLTFKQMGGSLGILAIGVGDNGAGFELTGFYQDVMNNFPILGRVNLISVAGDATNTDTDTIHTIYVNAIGVLGGTSLYIWMTSKLALRTEIALGFLYAMVDTDYTGNVSAASHFTDGVGFQVRGTFGVFYDMGGWQAMLEAAPQVTHSTSGFSIALGASSILK